MFFVNTNTGAYFNFQAENMPGVTWALDVTFDALGGVNYASSGSAQSYLMSTYPTNQWFEQKIVIDLSNNNWEVFHDGVSQGSFSALVNQIASIDYYPTAGQEFYVDDICVPHSWCTKEANMNDRLYAQASDNHANYLLRGDNCQTVMLTAGHYN